MVDKQLVRPRRVDLHKWRVIDPDGVRRMRCERCHLWRNRDEAGRWEKVGLCGGLPLGLPAIQFGVPYIDLNLPIIQRGLDIDSIYGTVAATALLEQAAHNVMGAGKCARVMHYKPFIRDTESTTISLLLVDHSPQAVAIHTRDQFNRGEHVIISIPALMQALGLAKLPTFDFKRGRH